MGAMGFCGWEGTQWAKRLVIVFVVGFDCGPSVVSSVGATRSMALYLGIVVKSSLNKGYLPGINDFVSRDRCPDGNYKVVPQGSMALSLEIVVLMEITNAF